MSNVIEYKDSLVFHPGYYVQELVEESGLTQEDFAKRLNTTPKNLSILIRGKQSLSADMALKLSNMLGTSVSYWLNLQAAYDAAVAEIKAQDELQEEKVILKVLDYGYFRDNFGLPDLPRKLDEQVVQVRRFLGVSSLTVLTREDFAVSFRSALDGLEQRNLIRANALVQIALNKALQAGAPPYDKDKFEKAYKHALTQTENHCGFYPILKHEFFEAGVVFIVLPNLPGSKINGATKKIGPSLMLMVNDRRLAADSFWFTLFHEVGHIVNGDFGASFENEAGAREEAADRFAEDQLIPPDTYADFVSRGTFTRGAIQAFARSVNRDPGIVLGRLQADGYVRYGVKSLESLRCAYQVVQG